MWDTKRPNMVSNTMFGFLQPAATTAEGNTNLFIDFLSNGFKLYEASGYYNNPAGGLFMYMAFAEQPFKYSNAR
jgi:hypothetical protein